MPKNRHNINLLWLKFTLLIIAGILLFNSCRTTSRVVVSEKADIDEKKLEKKHLNRLGVIKHMWIKKFSGELQIGDQVHQLKGNIRLVKDSIMIIGIQSAMGVEAIRIYLGQDSILVMNRLKRTYYYEPVHKNSMPKLSVTTNFLSWKT